MFGTATLSVGGSAGRPSLVSEPEQKPAIRITPSRWGRTAGREPIASSKSHFDIHLSNHTNRPRAVPSMKPTTEQDDVAAPREAAFGTPHERGTSAPRETTVDATAKGSEEREGECQPHEAHG